jgi:hydrogenase nickel incorporation protein HypA/HybF
VHELSVCQALLVQVADIASARGAGAVECITIEVGPLSGTEPALLFNAFMTMRSGLAAAARLRIKKCAVKIRCLACDAESEVAPSRLICGRCSGWQTRVIAGEELRLLRVEMRVPELIEQQDAARSAEQISYV